MSEQDKINQEKQKTIAALYALEQAKAEARLARNLELAADGVEFVDIRQAYIDEEATVGAGTVIGPCVTIEGKTQIGKNCFIGCNSLVLKGVHLGDGCVIGAGSVVTHDIPDSVVAAGNPCRVLREVSEHDREYYFRNERIRNYPR